MGFGGDGGATSALSLVLASSAAREGGETCSGASLLLPSGMRGRGCWKEERDSEGLGRVGGLCTASGGPSSLLSSAGLEQYLDNA
jgi:hypothetical protein